MPYIDQRVREILDRDEALRGAHPCAKLEFVRRVLTPYEDAKRETNGEVYS